jgi:hypothetical protein
MTKPLIKIYDVETDTTTEREMNDVEFQAWDNGNKAKQAKDALIAEAKTNAETKLAALGLTTDDLKALGL